MNVPEGTLVSCRGLRKDYGSGEGLVRAVDEVDIDVARGETVAVTGPSGCGKSTLLHLLGGLDRPTAGELWFSGRRTDQLSERSLAHLRRSEVGFVFQAFHLMDELTAQENVELPACSPVARRRKLDGEPGSCSNKSASAVAPGTCRRCSRVGSGKELLLPARSPTNRRSCWRTSRPATWTAPPPWR
jgi:ABC-type uncharacterized transport system ATPase subunit